MAKKILAGVANAKTRTLILFVVIILIIVVVITIFKSRKPNPLEDQQSRSSKIPYITAIPGEVTSDKYRQLQEEDNSQRAEAAKKTGGSAIATIIGTNNQGLLANDSFGIESEFKECKPCQCPTAAQPTNVGEVPDLDPALAAKLIAQIEANPKEALQLMQTHPGLAKALCKQNPDLALKIIENNKAAAKIMLNECPDMATALATKNPALFKQLMLENPMLAKKIAEMNPAALKMVMDQDPAFAKKLLLQNPEVAKAIANNDPAFLKKLMLNDPEFAKAMTKNNPNIVKELMQGDSEFAEKLAQKNPDLVKELMKNDPAFAKTMMQNNPGMVKQLMLNDPEFAKAMAQNNPNAIKTLIKNDPDFAKALAQKTPALLKDLMKSDPAFADAIIHQDPDIVKRLMLDDPEFAKAMAVHNANAVSSLMNNDPAFKKALLEKVPGINTILRQAIPFLNDKERLQALDEARRIQKAEQAQREQQLQLTEQQQKTLAAILTNMEAESKTAFQAWSEIPTQAFVQGEGKKEDQEKNKGGNSSNTGKSGNDPDTCSSNNTLIKAGTIFFAVLDTAVNTDEPGPIMATIVQGKFKGSKILGDVQFASQSGSNDRAEKVTLNFSTLSSPSDDKSIGIKGVAIDPDTARTALASAVDHHYLLRYGTLFASSFMTGYAKVISSQGGTVQTNPASGTTTTTTPPLNGRQQIFAALGQVGQNLGEATSTYFSSPNTITVNAGTGFGLLILSDVSKS